MDLINLQVMLLTYEWHGYHDSVFIEFYNLVKKKKKKKKTKNPKEYKIKPLICAEVISLHIENWLFHVSQ